MRTNFLRDTNAFFIPCCDHNFCADDPAVLKTKAHSKFSGATCNSLAMMGRSDPITNIAIVIYRVLVTQTASAKNVPCVRVRDHKGIKRILLPAGARDPYKFIRFLLRILIMCPTHPRLEFCERFAYGNE